MTDLLTIITGYVTIIFLLAVTVMRVTLYLHMMQLQGYRNRRFATWLMKSPANLLAVLPLKSPKKKLLFTARATRLFALTILLLLLPSCLYSYMPLWLNICALAVMALLAPFLLILSNLIIHPLESAIGSLYLVSPKRRLKRCAPKVIAITGSYGKTSAKDFLTAMLSKKYKTLKTPGSFNTPMGICKTIRGELKPEHEIFIVEMGAREKGDIMELCDFVRPDIGIITAIGPQHLEMFKTMENIIDTKGELFDCLPAGGVAVFNNDDEKCRLIAGRAKDKKLLSYGMNNGDGKLFLSAKEIAAGSDGMTFFARNCHGGDVAFNCKLLGRHNVYNILAAASVALELGMTLDEISGAVSELEPTPHLLQLIHGSGGVNVIDDAFNANPVGAMMALEVLSQFGRGKKGLVTPGLVELGEREYEENKKLGKAAAKVCDYVFLIGKKRTKPIFEGLKEEGFPGTNIFVEKSLGDATKRFASIFKAGDTILFENDLPDTYNE